MLIFEPDKIDPRRPLLMGVVNVTPDSFSDGGRFLDPAVAAEHALKLAADGADLIDLGAESTRPGAEPVSADEQIRRLVPVLRMLAGSLSVPISIDTTSAAVAEACLEAGAGVINDISAGRLDAAMLPLVARRGCPVVLMHMQGTPATMQAAPAYSDVVAEVRGFLRERISAAEVAGVARLSILLDPGIGFGKTLEHNVALLRALTALARPIDGLETPMPLVVGVSRKAMIGKLTGKTGPEHRLLGTAGAVAWCITLCIRSATPLVLRVHDVPEMRDIVSVVRALAAE